MTVTIALRNEVNQMEKFLTITKRKRVSLDDNNNNQPIPTSTDDKTEDTISRKNMKYDKTKRTRTYIPQWETTWPWLYYEDGLMYCKYCKSFPDIAKGPAGKINHFLEGSSHFRVESMKSHEKSELHINCTIYYKRQSQENSMASSTVASCNSETQSQRPIVNSLLKVNEKQKERLKNLFTIAYKIAKHGKPFTDFEIDCELVTKLGVDLGDMYVNRYKCVDFIQSIYGSFKKELIKDIQQSPYISVLADGSTDASTKEQENVCIRYLQPSGRPMTILASIEELEHSHADGVLKGIFDAISTVELTKESLKPDHPGPTIVCCNFDGAAVMQGEKNGVSGQLLKEYPHLIPVWCIAHKLQLAIMDSIKNVKTVNTLETTVKGVYKYYHGSPKRRREIKAVADILETDLANIPDVKEVRWLASQSKALLALKSNLNVIVMHLSEAATRTDMYSGVAKNYLNNLKNTNMLKTMYLLLEILDILADLSKFFQTESLLVVEVPPEVEATLLKLLALKTHPGPKMKEFLELYDPHEKQFGDIKLNGICNPVDFSADVTTRDMVSSVVDYIEKRFAVFNESPLKEFTVFDFMQWPTNRDELSTYGVEHITSLTEHFDLLFSKEERDKILSEFPSFKTIMNSLKTLGLYEAYCHIVATCPPRILTIVRLVKLMLTLSVSTAQCERVFSQMKILKGRLRCKLLQCNLQAQLFIMIEGPDLKHFSADKCITHWLEGHKRHIGGHKKLAVVNDRATEPIGKQID